jgi:serine/threonine-protein kinase HipA
VLAFNWVIGGTDAHAKNHSLLHGSGGNVRLATFYDLASVLPYEGFAERDLKLSMKIGNTYRLRESIAAPGSASPPFSRCDRTTCLPA